MNSEVLERKSKQAVFYQVLTLHRTLFWALRRSLEWKTALSLEFWGRLGVYRQNEVQTHSIVTSP